MIQAHQQLTVNFTRDPKRLIALQVLLLLECLYRFVLPPNQGLEAHHNKLSLVG
jgi:hypothetical protein